MIILKKNILFVSEVKTPKESTKTGRDPKFGNIYKDPRQKWGNKEIWWSKDTAGHGGSRYKLFVRGKKYLEWIVDVGEDGFQVLKHKSDKGVKIPIKRVIWRN